MGSKRRLIVLSVLCGICYWIVCEASSALEAAVTSVAIPVFWSSSLLLSIFAILQGCAAFYAIMFMGYPEKAKSGKYILGYAAILWCVGAAPLSVTDMAARYLGLMSPTGSGPLGIVRQVVLDILLVWIATFWLRFASPT